MMRPLPSICSLRSMGPLVRVTADAAYDTVAVYETAGVRGATVVVPPARTANVSGHGPRSPAQDRTITLVKTSRRLAFSSRGSPLRNWTWRGFGMSTVLFRRRLSVKIGRRL